jgi:hypothetical protein
MCSPPFTAISEASVLDFYSLGSTYYDRGSSVPPNILSLTLLLIIAIPATVILAGLYPFGLFAEHWAHQPLLNVASDPAKLATFSV